MKKYISKNALVAEIERRINICNNVVTTSETPVSVDYYQGKAEAYKETLSFLNTIEVKEVNPNDAFVKKAERWIDNFLSESTLIDYKVTPIVRNTVIENFKNYMKGE